MIRRVSMMPMQRSALSTGGTNHLTGEATAGFVQALSAACLTLERLRSNQVAKLYDQQVS